MGRRLDYISGLFPTVKILFHYVLAFFKEKTIGLKVTSV